MDMESIAKIAAKEAVAEMRKEERRVKRSKIIRNTEVLMKNYNRIVDSVEEGVSDLSNLTDEPVEGLNDNDEIFVESIIKSRLRSLVMLAHIDRCLKLLEDEQLQKNTYEKYRAFRSFYLENKTHEEISELLNCTDRTSRRWVKELTLILGIYLFGIDALLI